MKDGSNPQRRATFRSLLIPGTLVLAVCAVLAACQRGGSSLPAQTVSDTAKPSASHAGKRQPRAIVGDDWITFAKEYQRNALQLQNVNITPSTAPNVTLRWSENVGPSGTASCKAACTISASPLVWNGNIYIVTAGDTGSNPTLISIGEAHGKTNWAVQLPQLGSVGATPSIDVLSNPPMIFVADRVSPPVNSSPSPSPNQSYLFAFNANTGSLLWTAPVITQTHDAPVVVDADGTNGVVYIGSSDTENNCIHAGVQAFYESNGTPVAGFASGGTFYVNPNTVAPQDGGGVWGDIAYDPSTGNLLVPTSNSCGHSPSPLPSGMQGVDSINAGTGAVTWSFNADPNIDDDDDVGGGVMLYNGEMFFLDKNGGLYAKNATTGVPAWSVCLNPAKEFGDFSTPTTDGSTVVVGGGFPETASKQYCPTSTRQLAAYDVSSGALKWSLPTTSLPLSSTLAFKGYAAISSGYAFVVLDTGAIPASSPFSACANTTAFFALNLGTGAPAWCYPVVGTLSQALVAPRPSPVIVPSGLYFAANNGWVYAFNVGNTPSERRRKK